MRTGQNSTFVIFLTIITGLPAIQQSRCAHVPRNADEALGRIARTAGVESAMQKAALAVNDELRGGRVVDWELFFDCNENIFVFMSITSMEEPAFVNMHL